MKNDIEFVNPVWYIIDFEQAVKDGIDAIEFHLSDDYSLYFALYGWDCDSILILNPDIIVTNEKWGDCMGIYKGMDGLPIGCLIVITNEKDNLYLQIGEVVDRRYDAEKVEWSYIIHYNMNGLKAYVRTDSELAWNTYIINTTQYVRK